MNNAYKFDFERLYTALDRLTPEKAVLALKAFARKHRDVMFPDPFNTLPTYENDPTDESYQVKEGLFAGKKVGVKK